MIFVNQAPEEFLEEIGHKFLAIQESEKERIKWTFSGLGKVNPEAQRYLASGTTDSSAYLSMAETMETYEVANTNSEWVSPVIEVFSKLANEKAKKDYLPEHLNKLADNLGEMFTVAQQSVEKARGGLIGVDQAAIQLRDVLQQLWGHLANVTREKCQKYKDSRLELGREKHRGYITNCLGFSDVSKMNLATLLEQMANIASEISETHFGKNPLTSDTEKLNKIHRGWILVIDNIVNYLYLNLKIGD